jgi:5-formyltetrahydrofolate cyclo-ligase
MMNNLPLKQAQRRVLLAQRRSLSPTDWQARNESLCRVVAATEWFQQAQTVLAFFSFRQEPSLAGLWASPMGLTKRWGLPRCLGEQLIWHHWRLGEALVDGAFGIQEPTQIAPVINPAEADLILVPAVGCDRQGNRLGYGGGFYDRLLSREDCKEIPTIGIVFDFARLSQLPQDPWDCSLDAVCTERGFFPVGS